MTNLVSIVNLLYLLKKEKEPQTFMVLYSSGCFYNEAQLGKAITTCRKAGLITSEFLGRTKNPVDTVMAHSLHKRRWHKPLYLFYITTAGHTFLSFHDGWQLRKVNKSRSVKQVAVSET